MLLNDIIMLSILQWHRHELYADVFTTAFFPLYSNERIYENYSLIVVDIHQRTVIWNLFFFSSFFSYFGKRDIELQQNEPEHTDKRPQPHGHSCLSTKMFKLFINWHAIAVARNDEKFVWHKRVTFLSKMRTNNRTVCQSLFVIWVGR